MKVAKIISAIVVVLLIAALIAGLVLFINNGQSNFYVEYDGQRISVETSNVELQKGGFSIFYVKSVFGDIVNGTSKNDYEVTVSLAKNNVSDIEFSVDDDLYGLYDIEDFSSAFTIKKDDGMFMVYIPQNLTITEILQACYPNKEISINGDSALLWAADCFVLNVKYIVENKTITIAFH